MMKNELIQRSFDALFDTNEEEAGLVIGRPIVFNSFANLEFFDEVIVPGALDGADLNDVRFCLNHDTSFVYARSRRNNANNTMQLNVDQNGMEIRAILDIESSPKAQDLYAAIKRGDLDKMSFMFSIDQERWEDLDTERPKRFIEKIGSVVEVSAVTFPAYESTAIDARSKEALDRARSSVETARQQSEKRSVETDLLLAKAKYDFKKIF